MANKSLFRTIAGAMLPRTNVINEAGGTAYAFSDEHALAQYAATGCLNSTYYASAQEQLGKVLQLCQKVEPEFIAKTAIYAREKGFMKDLPALLCAVLSVRSPERLETIFNRVIDSPKMLRNFVQIMRSGVVGRKSLGSMPKRLIHNWLAARSDVQLFVGSVGNDPSLADIIKMVHPKPVEPSREALFGYLIGREHKAEMLPELVRQYEKFKHVIGTGNHPKEVPDVPFQMLTALNLGREEWKAIAKNASWQMTRMNLNTFARHGLFESPEITKMIAERLRDAELIAKARVFPYQLLMAYTATNGGNIPRMIRDALQDAMEIAIDNVPKIDGKVYVFPDVSGSMHSAVTGYRKGSTSAVRCIDVAALVAAAMLRKNPDTEVIPFHDNVVLRHLNPRDSVMTNAKTLASIPAGGTNCSAPLVHLNQIKARGDLIIYVSDNESWVDSPYYGRFGGGATRTMQEWAEFKRRSPNAKMVCIDIQPYGHTQAKEREDITNVGGFSDQVFNLIAACVRGNSQDHWVSTIRAIEL